MPWSAAAKRRTNERFATTLSAALSGIAETRRLLAGNAVYLGYLERGLGLVDVDGAPLQLRETAVAAMLRCCMAPAGVADMLAVGFDRLGRRNLDVARDTPDQRLVAFVREGGPASWTPTLTDLLAEYPDRGGDRGDADRRDPPRLAAVGRNGLRVRPPGARRGWRLALWESPRLPGALLLTPAETPAPPATDDPVVSSVGPRIFVAYAHDTNQHKALVLQFCRFLVSAGLDVHVDQWYMDRRRDWQLWGSNQIRAADFVLVITSPACRRVGDGDNDPQTNLGLQSEMRTLRELYHSEASWRERILPVVLPRLHRRHSNLLAASHGRPRHCDQPGLDRRRHTAAAVDRSTRPHPT